MPLGIDFIQILLHAFNVLILFGGLYFILYSPVKKFIEKREEHYRQMDEEKTRALEEANRMKEDQEAQLTGLDEEIAGRRQEAVKEIESLRSQRLDEARKEAAGIIAAAEKDAERRRKEIVDGAKDDISSLITDAADKLLLEGDTEVFYDAFLDEAERGADHV